MANIAFIGLGNMGGPMAANLVKASHKVTGFDLVEASRHQAKADGAGIADSAAAAVKGADVVITMLPAGKHVLSVWSEILPAMGGGSLIVDCSTIDVESAKQAHALAAKHGIASVDAPVSGGTGGAKDGQEDRALRRRRRGAGRENLQQHDFGNFHDRGQRSLCARRKTRPVASGFVRCGLDLVGSMLVADVLLPGAGTGADLAREQRL